MTAKEPLVITETEGKYDVIVTVKGGGFTGQAGAIRHGISRALLQADPEFRGALKAKGFLTRDARMKERKNTVLKQLVVHHNSRNVNSFRIPSHPCGGRFFCALKNRSPDEVSEQRFKSRRRSGA